MQSCPAAASSSVAPLVTGPARPVELLGVTTHAAYFATGDPDRPLLCLATADAVRLPCALVLGPGRSLPAVGHPAVVGGGVLRAGRVTVRVGRWWRPPCPRGVPLTMGVRGELGPATSALAHALATGAPLAEPVAALLGRGPGLTPFGDDILAGALVTLVGMGVPAAARLAATVNSAAPSRTTAVSAGLLRHAARGECVPELANLLHAARDGDPLDRPLAALLRVGHTSGAGLVGGVRAAMAAVA